jgi:hypothetical protein
MVYMRVVDTSDGIRALKLSFEWTYLNGIVIRRFLLSPSIPVKTWGSKFIPEEMRAATIP